MDSNIIQPLINNNRDNLSTIDQHSEAKDHSQTIGPDSENLQVSSNEDLAPLIHCVYSVIINNCCKNCLV